MILCACAKSSDLFKCLIAVVLVDVDLPYWTSKVEHLVVFMAIFSNICTAHAQKRLFMNFRCKFRHCCSIRRLRFPIRVQNFGDLATFFVYMTIHCRVIASLSADTARDLVTLTFDFLSLNSCHTWRVMWPALPRNMKTLCLSVLELWVITFPIGYHWKCVRDHYACAESRDPWVGGQKQLHFWNPRLPICLYSLYNFYWATRKIKGRLLSSVPWLRKFLERDSVTLTFDRLTLNGCLTWQVTWPTMPPSLKTLQIFVHELRVITVPIEYHWKCVCDHCACAESRDPWVGDQKQIHFWNPRPRFAY